VEVRVIENRGRDVSALLVGAADLVNKYDLICYVHDKKSEYIKPHSIGETWSDKLFECNLSSAEYVQNVIKEFRQDKFLGMTFPFAPFHGGFLPVLASNVAWNTNRDEDGNFSGVLKLLSKMELHVELDIAQPPVCPLGTMFWFRTSALKKLFALNWKYEDFPPEPNNLDGTILHTIERAYSPIVQGSGYYCAYIMPDNIATTEYNNLQVCTNSLYEAVLDSRIPRNSYNAILAHLNIRFDTTSRLRRLYGNAMHILVQIYHKMIGKT
jgi:rhamnosyltransferase